jgi:hypothetical protein
MRERTVIMKAKLGESVQPRASSRSGQRRNRGALYWSPLDDSTTVRVWDAASEETIVFAVPPDRALEAFYHPFAQLTTSFDELVPAADA